MKFRLQEGESGGDAPAGGAPADQGFHALIQNPELRTWAQSRGWKDPDSVVESFRNAEKLIGAPKERVLVLPDAPDSPEWANVHTRLGRPEAADGYQFELKGAYDEAFLTGFRQAAFTEGLPAKAASNIAKWWEGYVDTIVAEQDRAAKETSEAQLMQLRSEWGSGFDANSAAAKDAAQRVGLSPEQWDAIEAAVGPVAARKAFGLVASKVLEGGLPLPEGGGRTTFAGTPEAARMQLEQMYGDKELMAKYTGGDKALKQKIEMLSKIAYPDEG